MAEYIDRDKLIREGWSLQRTYRKDATTMVCEMKKPEDFPAADVRPVRRGRWAKKNDSPLDGEYCCSNCKQEIDIADGEETPLNRGMYYCPHCGADMRGGTDG